MSINTSSSAFRKIDVDQYNEDNFGDEDQGELQSPPVGPDESEVTALLNQYPFSTSVWIVVTASITNKCAILRF